MTTKLFILGSLCEGQAHFSRIKNLIKNSIVAKVKAKAVRLSVGFPALLSEEQDWVVGNVIELTSENALVFLDEYHGHNALHASKSLMLREFAEVFVAGSEVPERVQAYFLNPLNLPRNLTPIEGGNWMEALVQQPPLVNKLTDKQATYIHRLGKSTGREIVPIDLTLYRELMNLDLIIDKGRRLALSQLGREVYKYLV